jgi:hypothetical protein
LTVGGDGLLGMKIWNGGGMAAMKMALPCRKGCTCTRSGLD